LRRGKGLLLMALLPVLLAVALAFGNGANDVSKGVATLVGAGLATERRALLWGTAWTLLGAAAAATVSRELFAMFTGRGLLSAPPATLAWPTAVALGAAAWLALATRAGLPVSTTHALVGAIVGAGLVAGGAEGVRWPLLFRSVALPLLLSPVVSLAVVLGSLPPVGALFQRLGGYCVCVERAVMGPVPAGPAVPAPAPRAMHVIVGDDCPPRVITRMNVLDSLHWLTAGLTCFARGLNDAPKVAALGLGAGAVVGLDALSLTALVAAAMAAGSALAGRRVTGTLARGITPMSGSEALTANAATSALVGLAAAYGVPVSTTHVSTGCVLAIGLHRRSVQWRLAREILLAWVVTLPAAGLLAALGFVALR
jgi:PiT family inorganic phosphate transporter